MTRNEVIELCREAIDRRGPEQARVVLTVPGRTGRKVHPLCPDGPRGRVIGPGNGGRTIVSFLATEVLAVAEAQPEPSP